MAVTSSQKKIAKISWHGKWGHFNKILYECVTDQDFTAVARGLIADAKAGDKDARRELLARCCGPADAPLRMMQSEAELSRAQMESDLVKAILGEIEAARINAMVPQLVVADGVRADPENIQ